MFESSSTGSPLRAKGRLQEPTLRASRLREHESRRLRELASLYRVDARPLHPVVADVARGSELDRERHAAGEVRGHPLESALDVGAVDVLLALDQRVDRLTEDGCGVPALEEAEALSGEAR